MSNPVVALIDWLKSQDDDVQIDIAFLMSGTNPAFDAGVSTGDVDKMTGKFYSRIEEFSGTDVRSIGFLVAFKAIFDYLFLKKRGTDEGWEGPRNFFQSILDSTDSDMPSGMKEKAEKSLAELPDRREKWKSICRSWQELKVDALSEESIEQWERTNFLARAEEMHKPINLRAE